METTTVGRQSTQAEKDANNELVKRYDALGPYWSAAEEVLADIDRYIMPIGTGTTPGNQNTQKWTTREIWDSTAPIGAHRLASVFYSNLISTAMQWFGILFDLADLNKEPEAKKWIQGTSERMFNAINSSNFPLEMAAAFLEYVGPGAFVLTQERANEKKWEGFEFRAKSIRSVRFEENHLGRVRRYFVEFMWSPAKIISKFGKEGVPQIVLDRDAHNDTAAMPVLYAIYPREDKAPWSMTEPGRAPTERPFGVKYILRETKDTLGEESGAYEMTAYVGRYHRSANSPLGFGPSHLALPTVKLLNGLQESIVLAAEKVVDPATLVTERGLLSDLDLGKSGLTTVRSLEDIGTHESKARFDVSQDLLERHQLMVRKHYREDDISLKMSPGMTATETMQRVEQMNRLFGPQVGGLQTDVFAPLLQNTFNEMWRAGEIEPPPDVVKEKAAKLKIVYHGPMMRSLRSDDMVAVERLASGVAALTKMGIAEAGDVFDGAEAIRIMADRLSVPGELLRTPKAVEQLRSERMAMQQMAMMAEIKKKSAEGDRAAAGAQEMMGGQQ